jgi:hypothetical protein
MTTQRELAKTGQTKLEAAARGEARQELTEAERKALFSLPFSERSTNSMRLHALRLAAQ